MKPAGKEAVRSVVVGTAGHIDHGKTALVRALTGTDTDRLPEEKARGITIDLGFATLELPGPGGGRFAVSLVDVPGHHAFVRNMLAGAGGIEAVLLVVAADEGVKAQTVEHLAICRLLGIGHGLVVLTKVDAVGAERVQAARDEVRRLVAGSFLERAPVLPVSARTGWGLEELMVVLARVIAGVPRPHEERVPRLPVDRVFSVRGFGTVVTGTLQAGRLRAGESLVLEPGSRPMRVRGVQVHGKGLAEVVAPNRVALNVVGVEVGEVRRGDTAVPGGTVSAVEAVDAELDLLPGTTLRHRQRVQVHAFSADVSATVLLYERIDDGVRAAANTTNAQRLRQSTRSANPTPLFARFKLQSPMVLSPGDRFVLRLPSPAGTIGGGRVLDAHPIKRLKKTASLAWLDSLRGVGEAEAMALRVRRRGEAGISWDRLVAETGWTREAVSRLLNGAVRGGLIVPGDGDRGVIDAAALAAAEGRLWQAVQDGSGVPAAELRGRLRLSQWVFALAVRRLRVAGKLELRADSLVVAGTAKPAGVGDRAAEVEALYRAAGLAAPLASEVAERLRMEAPEVRAAITALLRAGKLVRLGSDALLVHVEALERLKTELRARHAGRQIDVAWFKGFTGLTRKHAIPLLEWLDGARVTRNVGGVRVVLWS